jgi:hypothetical protein
MNSIEDNSGIAGSMLNFGNINKMNKLALEREAVLGFFHNGEKKARA